MKFSNVIALGLASLAVASPVEKREASSITDVAGNLDNTVGTILSNVENLLGKVVSDVEGIASAAGIDVSSILTSSGISLGKRAEVQPLEARDDKAVVAAVEKLITDLVGELGTLSTTTGASLLSTVLSVLHL